MKASKTHIMAVLLLSLSLTACQITLSDPHPQLYNSLGQKQGISTLVEDFINEMLIDKRIRDHFLEVELDRTHDKLTEQFCQLAGGPCEYTGKAMDKIHADLKIDQGQFNAVVECLMLALDKNHISVGAQNQLLALLIPLRADIVTVK